jgi:PHD/YefM family antitoxin component YafN of YafNO toxin-antitoxin module
MNAVTVREAQRTLDQLIAGSLDEYSSWRETLYLLASPASARS